MQSAYSLFQLTAFLAVSFALPQGDRLCAIEPFRRNTCCGIDHRLPGACETPRLPKHLRLTSQPHVVDSNMLRMSVRWTPPASGPRPLGYRLTVECPVDGYYYEIDCIQIAATSLDSTVSRVVLQSAPCTQRQDNRSLCVTSRTLSTQIREHKRRQCYIRVFSLPRSSLSYEEEAPTVFFDLPSCRDLGCPPWEVTQNSCYRQFRSRTSAKRNVCTCKDPDRPKLTSLVLMGNGSVLLKWEQSGAPVSPVNVTRFLITRIPLPRTGQETAIYLSKAVDHLLIEDGVEGGRKYVFKVQAVSDRNYTSRADRWKVRLSDKEPLTISRISDAVAGKTPPPLDRDQ